MRDYLPLFLVCVVLAIGILLSATKVHKASVAWDEFSIKHHCVVSEHITEPMGASKTMYRCDGGFEVIR
jgi:hypothetical protein